MRLVLLTLSLLCTSVSLSACGNTRSPPEDVAHNPLSGTAFARATLGKMPDAARQAFKDKLKSESVRLDTELKTILTSDQPGLLGRMAVYAQARKANLQELKRRISIENGLLAQVDPEHIDFSGADTNSALTHAQEITTHRTVIAQAVLMAGVEQKFLRRALSTSPVLLEASQRQDDAQGSATEPSGNVVGTISYYIDEMKKEPCLFISPEADTAAPISIRGIELGMNRRKVLDTLCASENGEVRIQAQAVGQSYSPDSIRIGAQLLAWDAYRKGNAAYSPDFAGVNTWLASPENAAEIRPLAQSYLKTTRFCLHCDSTAPADNILSVEYAPEGTVVAIKHFQRFTDTTAVDSTGRPLLVDRANPQPMSAVLDPLRNQFGPPSFVFRNVAAWVYPDSETALQPEIWSAQASLDGLSRQVKVNNSSFSVPTSLDTGTPAFMTIYRVLSAQPTPATYCVSKYAYDGLDDNWPLKAIYADRFGARPYDHSVAAPGETDRCGVIVYIVRALNAGGDREPYINDATPVYSLTLSILNVGRLSDVHKREAQIVIDRMNALLAKSGSTKPVGLRH